METKRFLLGVGMGLGCPVFLLVGATGLGWDHHAHVGGQAHDAGHGGLLGHPAAVNGNGRKKVDPRSASHLPPNTL